MKRLLPLILTLTLLTGCATTALRPTPQPFHGHKYVHTEQTVLYYLIMAVGLWGSYQILTDGSER